MQLLALLGPELLVLAGVAQGDDQPGGGVGAADGPDLLVIQPAQDAGGQTLGGGLGGQVGGHDADVDGAVVIALDLGPQGGGAVVGGLADDDAHGCLNGELVHAAHAPGQQCHLFGLLAGADGQ